MWFFYLGVKISIKMCSRLQTFHYQLIGHWKKEEESRQLKGRELVIQPPQRCYVTTCKSCQFRIPSLSVSLRTTNYRLCSGWHVHIKRCNRQPIVRFQIVDKRMYSAVLSLIFSFRSQRKKKISRHATDREICVLFPAQSTTSHLYSYGVHSVVAQRASLPYWQVILYRV